MFLCQVTGKVTDFVERVDGDGQNRRPAYMTIHERRWLGGDVIECKHFLLMRPEQEQFAKKCVEKGWTVLALATNPRSMETLEAFADGYVLTMDLTSIQLP